MSRLFEKIVKPVRDPWRRRRNLLQDSFVFIHINKTGGTSIEKALKLGFEHRTALEKIEELGREEWDRRFSFAVVRNPWDKVVSHYSYRIKTNQTDLGRNPIPFREWVIRAYGEHESFYYDQPRMFMPQLRWIADEERNILVSFVASLENLQMDWEVICRRIGVKATLPHVKKSVHRPYHELYDDETKAIVAREFAEDLDAFGYDF